MATLPVFQTPCITDIEFGKEEVPMNPDDLKYHKEHTWARIENGKARVGITDYAQDSLGEVVYVELPETGSSIRSGDDLGEIESTKATSAIVSPVTGTVVEVNEDLNDSPEIVNEDPYGKGWIAMIELDGEGGIEQLLNAAQYGSFVVEEAG